MPNRREFLKDAAATAGLTFVGCGLLDATAQTQQPAVRKHAPVMIRGRRMRIVDIHAHCILPPALDLIKKAVPLSDEQKLEGPMFARRIEAMDAQGIDIAVLSINPNWYDAERDLAAQVITMQNDALAQFCGTHKDRFVALATVALQFPDLAAQQLERGLKTQGLRGVAIGGSVNGLELADQKFHPFFAKAEELGALIFIHPQQGDVPPGFANRLKGSGYFGNVVWNPLETTLALSHLIFEGTLDRFPGLKICAAHGGGYLASYMNRMDHGCAQARPPCTPGVPKKAPSEYLKQMYFDSLVFTPEALRHLAAEVGPGRLVIGTDYPFPWVDAPVEHVLNTPGLSDADREAILGGTAAKLLGLS